MTEQKPLTIGRLIEFLGDYDPETVIYVNAEERGIGDNFLIVSAEHYPNLKEIVLYEY